MATSNVEAFATAVPSQVEYPFRVSRAVATSGGAPLLAAANSAMLLAVSVMIRCFSAVQFPAFFGRRSLIANADASAEQGACDVAGSVDGEGGTDDGTDDGTEVACIVVEVDVLEEEEPQLATTIALANTMARPSERRTDALVRKVPMT